MTDQPLRARVSRAETLARRLETEIVTEALPPGRRLGTKDELRQRFGVAVGTLNEAVRLMEMRGLVAARPGPGGGLFVASVPDRSQTSHTILGLDWEQATLGDCVELRDALEPAMCRHVARVHDAADLRELEALVDAMEPVVANPQAYFAANWAFHRRVAEACENAPLRSVYLALYDFIVRGLGDFAFEYEPEEALAVHRELVAAIGTGEGPRLERAIVRHMARSPLRR